MQAINDWGGNEQSCSLAIMACCECRSVLMFTFTTTNFFQNGLKLHHTKLCGRRINVEVTCGGGGTSEGRRQKIRERNEKLQQKKRSRQKNPSL